MPNYEWGIAGLTWLGWLIIRPVDPSIRRSVDRSQSNKKSNSQEVACQCLPAWTLQCTVKFLFALPACQPAIDACLEENALQNEGGLGGKKATHVWHPFVWQRRPMLIRFWPTLYVLPSLYSVLVKQWDYVTIWFDNCRTLFDVCRFLLTLLLLSISYKDVTLFFFLRTKPDAESSSPHSQEPDQFGLIRIGNLFSVEK